MVLSANATSLITQTFDSAFYLARRPDVAAAGVDPLQHFLNFGYREGTVNFSPFFTINNYLTNNPDVAAAVQVGAINAWEHLFQFGIQEGRGSFSNIFDTQYYRAQNPDVAAAGINPLAHFLNHGLKENRNPSADFNLSTFIAANSDAAAALASGNVSVLQREIIEASQTVRTLTDSGVSAANALSQTATSGGSVSSGGSTGGTGGGGGGGGTIGFSGSYTLTDTVFARVSGVEGSAGADTLTLSSSGATFDFSSKTMTLVETILYGATTTGLTVDAADIASTTTITGNGSANTLTLNGSTNLSSVALTGVETIAFAGTLTVDESDIASVTALTGTSTPVLALNETINLTAVDTFSGNISVTLASGTTLTIDSGNVLSSGNGIGAITGVSGGGAETVVLSGGSADISGITFTDILSLTISNGATGATATISAALADVLTTLTGVAGGSAEIAAVTLTSGNLDASQLTTVTNAQLNITGSTGSNAIVGSTGADSIVGGNGTDTITGGGGADSLAGGTGADLFVYTAATDGGSGGDSITSYTAAADSVEVDGALQTALDDITVNTTFAFSSATAPANDDAVNITTTAEALFVSSANSAVTAANLTNLGTVATALNANFAITSTNGDDALIVMESSNTAGTFGVYVYTEAGTAEIQSGELQLLGVVTADAVTTADFIMA